jgi:hypothetical protein
MAVNPDNKRDFKYTTPYLVHLGSMGGEQHVTGGREGLQSPSSAYTYSLQWAVGGVTLELRTVWKDG